MEKKSVLIVDDNINLTKTLSFILKRKGFIVTTAKDGMEAIKKVKENFYSLVFMDIKMPRMNGVEVFKRIKKIVPNIQVMMMTAYAVEDLVDDALKEGAKGILYKPLDLDNLVTLVKTVTA